jgi:hypothetical protein
MSSQTIMYDVSSIVKQSILYNDNYMKLGLKVNADQESFERLSGANPQLAEVWFNINDANKYTELFDELKRRQCDVGLHFWGMLEHNIAPNIAYPNEKTLEASLDLMRQTIDIAAANHFQYVNIHPGCAALSQVNYAQQRYDIIQHPVDVDVSIELFLKNAKILSDYATSKNVVFTVETVPVRITDGWYDADARLRPKNIFELPVRAIVQAAQAGIPVANDFCHTAANVITDDPDVVWTFLDGTTKQLAPYTRLIHLGFIMPPYNGSDNHDQLDNPIMNSADAIPNTNQMIELLKYFKNRDDVWILVEPNNDHVKNYQLAKNLIERAS